MDLTDMGLGLGLISEARGCEIGVMDVCPIANCAVDRVVPRAVITLGEKRAGLRSIEKTSRCLVSRRSRVMHSHENGLDRTAHGPPQSSDK
jgi:hypothetical protein